MYKITVNGKGIIFSAANIMYTLKFKERYRGRIHRKNKYIDDWSIDNLILPKDRKDRQREHCDRINAQKRIEANKSIHGNLKINLQRSKFKNISDEKKLYLMNQTKCEVFGKDLILDDYWYHPEIDKKDPKKGYVGDNVQVVCSLCNRMKQDMTVEEFREVIKMAYESIWKE